MKDVIGITSYVRRGGRITNRVGPRLRRLSARIIHHSSFLLSLGLIAFALRSVGCQFDVTGNPDVNLLTVHASPATAAVPVIGRVPLNGSLILTATITGFQQSGSVTWTVVGSNNGTVVGNGLTAIYTAPPLPATDPALPIEIRAVPDEDPSRYVTCRVQLFIPSDTSFVISPDTVLLLSDRVQQFLIDTISLTAPLGPIHWSIVSGSGSITDNGLYTPPATVVDSAVTIVRATSIGDPSVYSTATITVLNKTDSLLCFTRDALPVLAGACGTSGCHDAGKRAAGYDFNTYAGTKGSLRGGATARSTRLYNSIIQFNAGSRMPPPPSPALTPNQVRIIGRWINDGGLDCE